MSATLWSRVDELIDLAPGLRDLRAHGLHLLAARRWRALGRPVPADLVKEEVLAIALTRAVPAVLREVRAACDGPVAIMKGPVVAARFPAASRRPFSDIDLLVPDASVAYEALVGAGFVPSGDPERYRNVHHQVLPLRSPTYPLLVELHKYPKWVDGLDPPPVDRLLEEAQPVELGVDGVLTLAPTHHVLVIAAHLWAHDPLVRLLRILDVAVMAEGIERHEMASVASAWEMSRLWQTTIDIADVLFARQEKQPIVLRVGGRGLMTARELTVVELHVGRLISPFCIYRRGRALRAVASALAGFLRRQEGESWRRKLARTMKQLTHPAMLHSEHVRSIENRPPRVASSGRDRHQRERGVANPHRDVT